MKKRSPNYRGALFILFIVSTTRTRIIYVLYKELIFNELKEKVKIFLFFIKKNFRISIFYIIFAESK